MILEVKSAWTAGEFGAGANVVADIISDAIGIQVAPTTLRSWLGRKGSNVN